MKKTYINPNIEVVGLATQQMLAVSHRGVVNESAEKTGEYYNDGRSFDFFDED